MIPSYAILIYQVVRAIPRNENTPGPAKAFFQNHCPEAFRKAIGFFYISHNIARRVFGKPRKVFKPLRGFFNMTEFQKADFYSTQNCGQILSFFT
jgi:hypothetical protein